MPVYNGEKTIVGAINSILAQTYENWELIIINDNSTDETQKEIDKFKDPRIRSYRCTGQGISAARNQGNAEARGRYCIVQDADDYSLPDRLEKVMGIFEKTDADIVIHSAYVNAWDSQYGSIKRRYLKAVVNKDELLKYQSILGWPAYKKSVWEAKPFREETKYAYDWMMHLDWVLAGYKYVVLDEGLYEYVRYAGSASDRFEKEGKRAEAFKKIKEIVRREYGKEM